MLKNYFKIAWRNIRRHKVASLINVLGLTLGICACLLIYLIIRFELSYEPSDFYSKASETSG